jgi:hypothetical protein
MRPVEQRLTLVMRLRARPLSFVGLKGAAGRFAPADWFVAPVAATGLCQDNLHAAMLARRRR